jgi:hypothetical protein
MGALDQVYTGWDRFRHRFDRVFGKDSELDELSDRLARIKERAFGDRILTPDEDAQIQSETNLVLSAYRELLEKRGFDLSRIRPASKESFAVFAEYQQIHFQSIAGKHLDAGTLETLASAAKAHDAQRLGRTAQNVAFELMTSPSESIAVDKVKLLRAALSKIPDRRDQLAAIDEVRRALAAEIGKWRANRMPPISVPLFDEQVKFRSSVATYATPLPDSVRGTNQLFPNKPIGAEWEATTRGAVAKGLDDMSRQGKLFVDAIPNDGQVKNVAVKLDLNLGADGPPSVSDPATTQATLLELLERADRAGKRIVLTVGDSAGGENIPVGRTTMDIMQDTGNYHMALKAGLTFAAKKGSAEAEACLALIRGAEARGVYFGSKDDDVTTNADEIRVEAACKDYVRPVDYDAVGYVPVDPGLGPFGLAAWGTREFHIARPWVDKKDGGWADYRVHVTRGLSNHMLAKWTGALKGLIGLHAFGLRPVDQSMEQRGESALDFFRFLSAGSVFSIFQKRTGMPDIVDKIRAMADPDLAEAHRRCEEKWDHVRGNVKAWGIFQRETKHLQKDLERKKEGGATEVEIANEMRWRTRDILKKAEVEGRAPGFAQALWDTVHDATRIALRAGWSFRGVLPAEGRDERVGQRIGLLTALPYASDLVIQGQPKIGLEGGPDAYRKVLDTGFISVGTDEASVDAVSWKRSGIEAHMWSDNFPLYSAQLYGRAPMHLDEIVRTGN